MLLEKKLRPRQRGRNQKRAIIDILSPESLMVVNAGCCIPEEMLRPDGMNAVLERGARPPDLIPTIQKDVERGGSFL
jgi:hypothetical protein